MLILFGAFHLILGAGLFGLVAWFLFSDSDDGNEDEGGGGGGSGGIAPRPWRPRPSRRRVDRGPRRMPSSTRGPGSRRARTLR